VATRTFVVLLFLNTAYGLMHIGIGVKADLWVTKSFSILGFVMLAGCLLSLVEKDLDSLQDWLTLAAASNTLVAVLFFSVDYPGFLWKEKKLEAILGLLWLGTWLGWQSFYWWLWSYMQKLTS
jgi:hypothetical protein